MLRISHSQKDQFLNCPYSWFVSYMLYIRREKTGSALPFGIAFDESQEIILLENDYEKAKKHFINKWTHPELNGVEFAHLDKLPDVNNKVHYYKSDRDESLFKDAEIITAHESLMRKGLIMLEQWANEFVPLVRKVIVVQKKVEVKNNIGDIISGKVDLIAEMSQNFTEAPGAVILWDGKTSSKAYSKNKIETEGEQLAVYNFALEEEYGIDLVGYHVTEKKMRVKDPRTRIQMLVGKVPDELLQKTINQYDQMSLQIKQAYFPKNAPNCTRPFDFEPCICQLFKHDNYEGFEKSKKKIVAK